MSRSVRKVSLGSGQPVSKPANETDTAEKGSHCQPIFNPAEWITKSEAARLRGVSRQAIGKLVSKGRLTVLSIAGRALLKRTEIVSYQPESGGRPSIK